MSKAHNVEQICDILVGSNNKIILYKRFDDVPSGYTGVHLIWWS